MFPIKLAKAQITPDGTLGTENSTVTPDIIKGIPSERIDGGAIRGANLFHSFQEFNIREGRGAYFTHPSGIENILTRVSGNNVSNILGTLGVLGNANLFLINPNGIVFGQNARLDIGGSFFATTSKSLVLKNGWEFSATNPQAPPLLKINLPLGLQSKSNPVGDIANAGNLAVNPGESLTLWGNTVTSTGSLIAPGGTVQLLGERVGLFDHARIDVSGNMGGGTVLIGGDFQGKGSVPNATRTYIGPDVTINADAKSRGNGGKVIVWADEATGVYGNISARGGSISGNGGFVEVSGRDFLDFQGNVDTSALNGNFGNLLLDPNNIEIVASAGNTTDTNLLFTELPENARITAAAINNANSNVTLEARNDITFNAPINITAPQLGLTATANRQIVVNSPIKTNNGDINLAGLNGNVNGIDLRAALNSQGGNIILQGTSSGNSRGINISSNINSNGGDITLIGSSANEIGILNFNSINSGGGNISFTGNSNGTGDFARGINIQGDITSEGGEINFSGTSKNIGIINFNSIDSGGGQITFTGTSTVTRTGIIAYDSINSVGGDIILNAIGNITLSGSAIDSSSTVGNAGSISLIGNDNIFMNNGAKLEASIFQQGNAGKIAINTPKGFVTLDGKQTGVFSTVKPGAAGNGGDIDIQVESLFVTRGAQLLARNNGGRGNAGNVTIKANDTVSLVGFDGNAQPTVASDVTGNGIGNSNNIKINARKISLADEAIIAASILYGTGENGLPAKGGDVNITATDQISLNNSRVYSEVRENSFGNGGSINIKAPTVSLDRNTSLITQISETGVGKAGSINVTAENLSVMGGSQLEASTSGTGDAGSINIAAKDSVLFKDNGGVFSTVESGAVGNGGNIDINITKGSLSVTGGAQLLARSSGSGDAGKVTINADTVTLAAFSGNGQPTIGSDVNGYRAFGNGNNINIKARSVELKDEAIIAASILYGKGKNETLAQAGDVIIKATEKLSLTNASQIFSEVGPNSLGNGGNISITAPSVSLNNSYLRTEIREGKGKQAGNINIINADSVSLSNGAQLLASTSGQGNAGNIDISTKILSVIGGSQLKASTLGIGDAGNLTIKAPGGSVSFDNGFAYSTVERTAKGKAGGISIDTNSLKLINDAQISASTASSGKAGDILLNTDILTVARGGEILALTNASGNGGTITVNAPIAVNLGIDVQDFAPVVSVETTGAGKAGDIFVTTPTLTLSDTARITATATKTATNTEGGGSISLNASKMNLAGIVGVFAETQGESPAGTLRLQPDNNKPTLDLLLAPGATISASTSASGNGGDLLVSAPRAITITGQGKLAVETTDIGKAGNIEISTQQLTLNDGVKISASTSNSGQGGNLTVKASEFTLLQNQSSLLSEASGGGAAGDVTVNTPKLRLQEGAKISANTISSVGGDINLQELHTLEVNNSEISASTVNGRAGSLRVNATNSVLLGGASSLSVAATADGTAGNLSVNTGQFNINGSQVTVSSDQGQAGNLGITANSLFLNQGRISAETFKSGLEGGANIKLQISEFLQMKNESQISATARENANGGNINIDSQFLIAFPSASSQGNDIIAKATFGNGGRININTQGIFGIEEQKATLGNQTNDIDASSDFGASGEVQINTAIDPSQGLTQLPIEPSQPKLAPGCQASVGENQNKFIITGRGGLPLNPNQMLSSQAVDVDWVSFAADAKKPTGYVQSQDSNYPNNEIVEAQGLVVDANGNINLVASAPTTTPHSSGFTSVACAAP